MIVVAFVRTLDTLVVVMLMIIVAAVKPVGH